jgi:hypothetical protein
MNPLVGQGPTVEIQGSDRYRTMVNGGREVNGLVRSMNGTRAANTARLLVRNQYEAKHFATILRYLFAVIQFGYA